MSKEKQKRKEPSILYVEIREAKPNKMFSEQQRAMVRFLLYNKPVVCAECGKKAKVMWTMLCQFKAGDMKRSFVVLQMGASRAPLTPVCDEHPLSPDWPEEKKDLRASDGVKQTGKTKSLKATRAGASVAVTIEPHDKDCHVQ
jgi:hypothetical protein